MTLLGGLIDHFEYTLRAFRLGDRESLDVEADQVGCGLAHVGLHRAGAVPLAKPYTWI